jgi:hypothetical protein
MDQNEIPATLNAILNSNEFSDSSTYKNLLSYLVNASLQNKIPKEITVAIEVFEKDVDFNSNKDSTVRYHVHSLRKKLEKYYRNEGRADKIRFIIPKGHYEVKFIKKKSLIGLNIKSSKLPKNPWIYIAFFFLLTNFFVYFGLVSSGITGSGFLNNADFKFWSDYFNNNFPTSVIIGDDFLIDEYRADLNRYRQIRDWEINSESDLNTFLQQFPNQKAWHSEIHGIPYGMVNNLFDLFSISKNYNTELSFNLSSNTNLDALKNHNLIYIGEFHNLRVLNKILFSLPIRFQYEPDEKLFLLSEDTDTIETFLRIEAPYQQEDKFNVDYSVLVSMPGPAEENFIFIVGFGYSGRLERTRMLADSAEFNAISKELGFSAEEFPQYFLMIFEVESIERTGFKNTLKYFKSYSRDFFK